MLRNYLKTAFRNLWKQKLFSGINILGFALGLTVTLLIFIYVDAELSRDDFHANKEQLYRVLRVSDLNSERYRIGVTSGPFAPALLNDFPESIRAATRVMPSDGLVTVDDRSFLEDKFFLADPNFFEFFSFELERGDPASVLKLPNSVVLTREIARKYFGEEDPIGQTMKVDHQFELVVSGILATKPERRSHLNFDLVASIELLNSLDWFHDWWNNNLCTYVQITDPAEAARVEARLPGFMDKYFGDDFARNKSRINLTLQPLSEVYFQKEVRYDPILHGDKATIYIFSAIAMFVLFVACINFINLTVARAGRRAKEIGIRKTLGAFRVELILQFLGESLLVTVLAVVISVAATELLLPYFNATFDLDLSVRFAQPGVLLRLVALTAVVAVIAGGYPAFFLATLKPQRALKARQASRSRSFLRRGLVVFQFCVAVFLILGTLVISQQLDFLRTKNLGFDQEHVVLVRLNNREIRAHREDFKNRLLLEPGVKSASLMSGQPGGFHDTMSFDVQGKDESWRLRTVFTDFDYARALSLEIVAGRDFSKAFGADAQGAVMLNETAVRKLGWSNEQAIGKQVRNTMTDDTPRQIVGVVRDYHFSSLKESIEPLIILHYPQRSRLLAVRILSDRIDEILAILEKHWTTLATGFPIEFSFLDDTLDNLYRLEQRESQLFSIFAAVAIIIACLGIFVLAAFTAEERTREIGIRKVLGASVSNVSLMLSKEFGWLALAANIVAWPIGYFAMNAWLEDFAYRVELTIWPFIVAGIAALLLAFLTVSFQSVKAALANPVESLKFE